MSGVRTPPGVWIYGYAESRQRGHSRLIRGSARPVMRSMQPHSVVSLLLLAALPACNRSSASTHAEPRREPVVATPTTPPSAVVAKDDIAGLFRAESSARRAEGVRVEDVLAAFKTTGVDVTNVRQHLAKPFGADYCAGADAGSDVVLSICEYRTPEAAAAGRAASQKGLASIPNRTVSVNGSTTLTLRERQATAQSDKVASALEHAFENVKK